MAVDYLERASNTELIREYDSIGDKLQQDIEYELNEVEFLIMSSMSKRKLIHKSKYVFGLPSKWDDRYSKEAIEKRQRSIELARQYIKNRKECE